MHSCKLHSKAKPNVKQIYVRASRTTKRTTIKIEITQFNVNCHSGTSALLASSKRPFLRANVSFVRQELLFVLIKDEDKACAFTGIYVIGQRTTALAGKHANHYTLTAT